MKMIRRCTLYLALLSLLPYLLGAQEAARTATPAELFTQALQRLSQIVEPPAGQETRTFSTRIKIIKANGLSADLLGREVELDWQAPDRFQFRTEIKEHAIALGRAGGQLWIHAPAKQFGVIGQPGLPRFSTAPERLDETRLGPVKLPLTREKMALLPLLMQVEAAPREMVNGTRCHRLQITAHPQAIQALKLPEGRFELWLRETDLLPLRAGYADTRGLHVQIEFVQPTFGEARPGAHWQLPRRDGDQIETVALSHLLRGLAAVGAGLNQHIPTLGPVTGERRIVATAGEGRLEIIEGTKVLFLKGSPEEIGWQHGTLLKAEVRAVVDRILYGVGVGSSFAKGRWFFGEIEEAQQRLLPFMDARYLREMDALATTAGLDREEVRLANFFPELFHCSGFALYGDATADGRMYHGRVLDYLKGAGLEQNAVLMVVQPNDGHAWVNVSYAGFVGSVTGMNERQIAIGEMGGRGEGDWDGKPMAQLVREVMEQAGTIEEAVEIMRRSPRTCEYYYVISDGKSKRAVGIAATPTKFETVWAGESHPLLPHAFKDAVLLSAGDRYEKLAERVKEGYGQFTADSARQLMEQPVAMTSNIHSVLFAPDTLDFWVANADSQNVASHTRYTLYNLLELLKREPQAPPADAFP